MCLFFFALHSWRGRGPPLPDRVSSLLFDPSGGFALPFLKIFSLKVKETGDAQSAISSFAFFFPISDEFLPVANAGRLFSFS